MIFRVRVTTKSEGLRNHLLWEGKSLPEARRELEIAKKSHDYAYILMEDEDAN
jgi:hypothetical protein